jgi:8-oxo-dGTP pyrophosphatase MutT (NUDIX family)
MIPWHRMRDDVPILVTIYNEDEGDKYVTIPVDRRTLKMPTKSDWITHEFPSFEMFEFKELYVNGVDTTIYHTDCMHPRVTFEPRNTPTNWRLKLYNGEHSGLDRYHKEIMKAIHRKYFCSMGFLEVRRDPWSPGNDTCLYPPSNAGVIVYTGTASGVRVCLIQERRGGKWNIPSGKIDGNETGMQAALRELHEETSGVIKLRPSETNGSLQIGSYHLVFAAVRPGYCTDATNTFRGLRECGQLGQNETIDMKWVLVPELVNMLENGQLRGCFAFLLADNGMLDRIAKL